MALKLLEDERVFETSEDVEVLPTFDALGLKEDLLRGVYAYGYERPSAVQQRAILPILKGRDVIVQSPRCSGKTLVFTLGALQTVDTTERDPQVHCCSGGKRVSDDIRALEAGVHIVSGTCGRVFQMIIQRHFSTRHIKMLVLDEADEMLQRSFKEQLYDIYRYLPPSTQVVLVSANMPQELLEMNHKFMNNPFRVLLSSRPEQFIPEMPAREQHFVQVEREKFKFDTLCDLLGSCFGNSIILCGTPQKVGWLSQKMRDANFSVETWLPSMPPQEQDRVLRNRNFSNSLISTGFPKGIQLHFSQVICYDLPHNREMYEEQISFGLQYGRNGKAISFVKDDEMRILHTFDPLGLHISELLL